MVELKTIYPFKGDSGLIKHYAEDENGVQYKLRQIETNEIYDEAVDVYPCAYTYEPLDEPICQEFVEEIEEGE